MRAVDPTGKHDLQCKLSAGSSATRRIFGVWYVILSRLRSRRPANDVGSSLRSQTVRGNRRCEARSRVSEQTDVCFPRIATLARLSGAGPVSVAAGASKHSTRKGRPAAKLTALTRCRRGGVGGAWLNPQISPMFLMPFPGDDGGYSCYISRHERRRK